MTRTDHPNRDVLLSYLRDELPKAEADTIGMHLGGCETCVNSLEQSPAHRQLEQLLAAAPAADIAADVQAAAPLLDSLKTRQPASTATLGDEKVGFLAAPAGPDELGRLGRYRVLAELGAGGMGRVFQAQHPVMERIVALKVISPRLMSDPAAVARFRREVKAAARLQHPNIVAAYDADEADGVHFLVMEYVDGTTLAELLRRRKRLGVRDAARVIRQAALALQYAHEQGMVHRDLKPSNLMVTQKGTVKIMDLGLARIVDDAAAEPSLTSDHTALGTPDYMAPEQARNAHSADARSDIYSLGATLYHLVSGQVPFPDGSAFERLMIRQTRDPKPLSEIAPDVPPGLVEVVTKMMCRDPEGRYQTPAEVAQALAPFARAAESPAKTSPDKPAGRKEHATPVPSKLPGNPIAVAGLAVAAMLLLVLALVGIRKLVLVLPEGTLVIEVNQPDAEVRIEGSDLEFKGFGGKLSAKVSAGQHRLLVTKDGFETHTESFSIQRGGKTVLSVVLHQKPPDGAVPPNSEPAPALETIHPKPPDSGPAVAASDSEWAATLIEHRALVGKHGDGVFDVVFAPDGSRLVSSGGPQDPSVRVWDVAARKELACFREHKTAVSALDVSPDGRYVISGDAGGAAWLWELQTGRAVRPLGEQREVTVFDVACSPDGKHALAGTNDGRMRQWDLESGREIRSFGGHGGGVLGVACSSDGRLAASGCGDTILRLWDLADGDKPLFASAFDGEASWVYGVAFSTDNRHIFSGTASGLVQQWNVAPSPGKKRTLPKWHEAQVTCLSLSPDGQVIATAGADHRVILWDAVSGDKLIEWELPGQYQGPWHDLINGVAFASDGRHLGIGGPDGTVHVIRLAERAPSFADVKPLFQDDFDDPTSGFPVQDEPGKVQSGYAAGRYFLNPRLGHGSWGWNLPTGKFEDFACELVGRAIGRPEDGWGICIGNPDNNTYGILVTLTDSGHVSLGPSPFEPQPERGPNVGPLRAPASQSGEHFNRLVVTVRGRTVRVYVNSFAVGKPTTIDRDITPGIIALFAVPRHGGTAEFDRVTVWPLPAK